MFKVEDILNAAIQNAGLDSNLQIFDDNENSSSSSSSMSYANHIGSHQSNIFTTNESFMDDEDFSLDLDFSILNSDSPSTSPSASSIASTNTSSIIADDIDPFLLAFRQLDDPLAQAPSSDFNQNLITQAPNLYLTKADASTVQIVPSKVNSSSDLLTLINYRANLNTPVKSSLPSNLISISGNQKPKPSPTTMSKIPPISSPVNSPKVVPTSPAIQKVPVISKQVTTKPLPNPIKVINLTQLQQKPQSKLNHKIIQINNNSSTTTTSSGVKITKVVSSRPFINNTNSSQLINHQNVVYYNKSGTKLGEQATMRLLGHNSQYITKTSASQNTKVPLLFTQPKIVTAQYLNSNKSAQTTPINNLTTTSSNSHINVLNSNINRYLNQNQNKSVPSNNSNNSSAGNNSAVTVNPRYLTNVNNTPGGSTNSPASNSSAVAVLPNYQQYFLEPDEEVVVEEEEELGHAETYANYKPAKRTKMNYFM